MLTATLDEVTFEFDVDSIVKFSDEGSRRPRITCKTETYSYFLELIFTVIFVFEVSVEMLLSD